MTDFDKLANEMLHAGFSGQVRASLQQLHHENPGGVKVEHVGLHAWNRLDENERVRTFPFLLGAYVLQHVDELRADQIDQRARDTSATHLAEGDVPGLWDELSIVLGVLGTEPDVVVAVDAQALMNVLSELEVLQRRLALNEQDGSA